MVYLIQYVTWNSINIGSCYGLLEFASQPNIYIRSPNGIRLIYFRIPYIASVESTCGT